MFSLFSSGTDRYVIPENGRREPNTITLAEIFNGSEAENVGLLLFGISTVLSILIPLVRPR